MYLYIDVIEERFKGVINKMFWDYCGCVREGSFYDRGEVLRGST